MSEAGTGFMRDHLSGIISIKTGKFMEDWDYFTFFIKPM
jgi:hypothetical protein